jgi:alpha-glucosidase
MQGSTVKHDLNWWRQAVVYEIYPRSFMDLNGDGIGDIAGITSKVEYLSELGVDAVWLTPFYPSPLADGGYDVADYRDVDPRLGNLRHFATMLDAFHGRNVRVFVDIVPNHTSDQHEWFQEALAAGRGSAARERFIFREGRGVNGELPPNDWPSHWATSCWTRVSDGQWYLHLFAPEQPDLNWEHADVRADFLETLHFWARLGVDGFRVDVAHGLVKDMSEPHQSLIGLQPEHIPADGSHPLFDREGLLKIYAEWREVLDSYAPPLVAVGEVGAPLSRRGRYTSNTALHQAFNFELLEAAWDANAFQRVIDQAVSAAADSGSSCTWVLSNHDVVRHASRYGLPAETDLNAWLLSGGREPQEDRELGAARARAAAMLLLALPGSTYLYQGEELGLSEVATLTPMQLDDPIWVRSNEQTKGRDGCRVPLPWEAASHAYGFSSDEPHLPQPTWFGEVAADVQAHNAASTLSLYRQALHLRRDLLCNELLQWGPLTSPEVLDVIRPNGWRCITNFGSSGVTLPAQQVLLASAPILGGQLPANASVWLRVAAAQH